jgi:hypothetical protein
MVEKVKELLNELEAKTGSRVRWLAYQGQSDPVRHVRIELYPDNGKDVSRMFNLSDGLTPVAEQMISDWFIASSRPAPNTSGGSS